MFTVIIFMTTPNLTFGIYELLTILVILVSGTGWREVRQPHLADLGLFTLEARMTIASERSRQAARKRVLMKATLITVDGHQDVRVTDLNASGARVEWARMIPTDEDVLFRRGSTFVAARVAWSKRKDGGLEFYRELPLAEPDIRLVFERVA